MAGNEKKHSNENISIYLRRELKELKDILSQKDTTIEDLNSQIKSKEREISRLHYDLDSLEKRTTLLIKQLNDKILNISGILLSEQQSSGDLNEKYQTEQKRRISSEAELIATKSLNKDLELKIKDLEIRNEIFQATNLKQSEKLNTINENYEILNREYNIKSEFLKQYEMQSDQIIGKQIEENRKIKEDFFSKLSRQEMLSEDLLTRLNLLYCSYQILDRDHKMLLKIEDGDQKEIENLLLLNKLKEQEIQDFQIKINEGINDNNYLKEQIQRSDELIKGLNESNKNLENSITELKSKLSQKSEEINSLIIKIKKIEHEMNLKLSVPPTTPSKEAEQNPENKTNQSHEKEKEINIVSVKIINEDKYSEPFITENNKLNILEEVKQAEVEENLANKENDEIPIENNEIIEQNDLPTNDDRIVTFMNNKDDEHVVFENNIDSEIIKHEVILEDNVIDKDNFFDKKNVIDEDIHKSDQIESDKSMINIMEEIEKQESEETLENNKTNDIDINPFIIKRKNIVSRKSIKSSMKSSTKSDNHITAKLPSVYSNQESIKSEVDNLNIASQNEEFEEKILMRSYTNKLGYESIGISTDLHLLDPLIEEILAAAGLYNSPYPTPLIQNSLQNPEYFRHSLNNSEITPTRSRAIPYLSSCMHQSTILLFL